MSIAPVGGSAALPFVAPTLGGAASAAPSGFAQQLDQITALTDRADGLATDVATGSIEDVHEFTAAASKAQLGLELTVALRNKAVEAYQEIMRMQV